MTTNTELLWENYQMRQAHVWKSLERLILAVVTLWAIPFIKTELLEYKIIIFLFPIVALFLSIFGRKIFIAEYARLKAVFEKIKEEEPSLDFMNLKSGKKINDIIPGQIGNIIRIWICGGLIALSVADLSFIILKISGIVKHL